ncbi:hypothetical protein [Methylorubrum podarium]|jgi:hypothetical protein|uniref:hypothetical protein n=1 Tax=Methylorubrum podarium TaxID=200476 RepID=UPI001EE2D155|nr:hypothetical protein [Methylorubrum podarium]
MLPIEEILGPIEREPNVPGTRPGESEKVRYISFQEPRTPDDVFEEVPWVVEPPLPKRGGVILEGCILTLPDGLQFCALLFHSDVEAWQRQIVTTSKFTFPRVSRSRDNDDELHSSHS